MATESLAELARFAPDVYGFRWDNHVGVFIVTDEGVILIDPIGQVNPHTPALIKDAIKAITPQPVKYVVYSHWGADHGMGGAIFADTAQFVGQQNVVEKIAEANDPGSPVPTITFDRQMTLELGGRKVELYAADLSAKDNYLILHDPKARLIMTVDFVQPKNLPFRTLLGNPDMITERLKWIDETLDFDIVISGHASPTMTATREDVRASRQYFFDLSDAIEKARAGGHADGSPEMIAAVRETMTPKYGDWRRFNEFLGLNVEGMLRWRAQSA